MRQLELFEDVKEGRVMVDKTVLTRVERRTDNIINFLLVAGYIGKADIKHVKEVIYGYLMEGRK